MAQVTAIDIDTTGTVKSLSELRKQINSCKNALFEMQEGTEEYDKTARDLSYAQQELADYMLKTSKNAGALEGSYNALCYQMSQLKNEWRATNDEARKQELTEQIARINAELKNQDSTIGDFQRNVGDYTNAMTKAFNGVGLNIGNINPLFANLANSVYEAGAKGEKGLAVLNASVKGLGASLKTLAANPIGAIIMAIVIAVKLAKSAFDAFKNSVKGNEEASNNMAKAMAPLKAIINGVKLVFDNLVESITKVLSVMGQVTSAIMEFFGIADEQVKLENDIANMQASNAEKHRENIVKNAELELEASEARAKAADKENYTNEERLKFINEYAEKQKELAANALEEAQNELALLEAQAATGKNNKEMNDKLAEAQAKVLRVQKDYNNTLRETNAKIHEISNGIRKDEAAALKEAEDRNKKAAEAAKKHAEEVRKATDDYKKMFASIRDAGKNEYELSQDKIDAELDANLKILAARAAVDKAYAKSAEYQNDIQALNLWAFQQTTDLLNKERQDRENFFKEQKKMYLNDAEAKIVAEQEKWNKVALSIQEALKSGLISGAEAEELMNQLVEAEQKAILKIKDDNKNAELSKTITDALTPSDSDIKDLKDKIVEAFVANTIDESKAKELLASLGISSDVIASTLKEAKDKAEAVKLGELFTELAAGFQEFSSSLDGTAGVVGKLMNDMINKVGQLGTAIKTGEKGWKTYANIAGQSISSVGTMLGSLADQQKTDTKEGFEQQKKLQVAASLMNMLGGIVSAWSSAMNPANAWMTVYGQIAMGAAMSAMMAGTAAAQISQIQSTSFGGSSSASAGSTSLPSYASVSPVLNNEADINSMISLSQTADSAVRNSQKVYILQSELEASGQQVRVRERNTSF